MTVWMQQVGEGGLEGLLHGLEQMPGFVYLHLLESPEVPHKLVLIYWRDEISMLAWSSLTQPCGQPQTFSLQRSLGPDVL